MEKNTSRISAYTAVDWFSGKSANFMPPDVRFYG